MTDLNFQGKVHSVLTSIEDMLVSKNKKYGNSALNPVRVFSKASPEEQILVRLDDKLSRIKNRQDDEDEDVINDLIGYLVLLKLAQKTPFKTMDDIKGREAEFVQHHMENSGRPIGPRDIIERDLPDGWTLLHWDDTGMIIVGDRGGNTQTFIHFDEYAKWVKEYVRNR